MSIIKQKICDNAAILGVWETTESLKELQNNIELNDADSIVFESLTTEKRKKEWLSIRCLLSQLLPEASSIHYLSNGKPYLDNYTISISHSGKFVAVLIHQKNEVGIDIQVPKKSIEKGTSLFLTEKENWILSQKNKNDLLHLYWCGKEAAFKLLGNDKLVVSDIEISPQKHQKLLAYIHRFKKSLTLTYEITPEYFLVYTT